MEINIYDFIERKKGEKAKDFTTFALSMCLFFPEIGFVIKIQN